MAGLAALGSVSGPTHAEDAAPPAAPAAEQAPDAETLYRQGRAARLSGQPEEALERLRRAAALEPDNADIDVEIGLALAVLNRYDEARAAFTHALKAAPHDDDAEMGLARVEFWSGHLDAADAVLARVLARGPDNADATALAAQVAAARTAAAAAARSQSAPQAAGAGPAETQPAEPKAAVVERPPQALPEGAARRRTAAPPRQDGGVALARALRAHGRFPQAEAAYQRALRGHPRDVDIMVDVGLMQAFQGPARFADARRSFEQALALEPRSVDARLGLARLDLYTKALDQAERRVADILDEKPDYPDAVSLRAQIRLARGDPTGAERDFRSLVGRDPRDSDSLIGLGDAVRAQYRDEEARALYIRARELAPASRDVAARLDIPVRPRWRLDLDGEYSGLTRGLDPWQAGSAHLGYTFDDRTTLGVGVETDRRFDRLNTVVDGRVDHRWSDEVSTYAHVGFGPGNTYRPTVLGEVGGSVQLWKGAGLFGPTQATLDLGIAHYRSQGDVRSFSPGIVQYFAGGRFWLTAKFIGTVATNNDRLSGFSIRGDALLTDKLSVFIGYADAPDNSNGVTVPSKAVFGGASYAFSDRLSVRTSVAREERRNSYSRTTFSLGLTAGF